MKLNKICQDFNLKGELLDYELITSGNINLTYKIYLQDNGETKQYLLQKINRNVFNNPEKIMENIKNVNDYIDSRHKCEDLFVLHFLHSVKGEPFVIDEDNGFWRACKFFNCVCYDSPSDLGVIEEAGRAFGQFQYLLNGFDAENLFVIIPNFHNTKKRIDDLEKTLLDAPSDKIAVAKGEIEYLLSNKELGLTLSMLLNDDKLPLRVTHNDTKCNNVIFDKQTLKALAVIDLDTIMPGLCAYDFGDGARSICSTTDEDEQNLSLVSFDLDRFERFSKGYLKYLKSTLTDLEKQTLPLSVFVMTYELASRFLEDYLKGNVYFKVNNEDHNLHRARCQIALCKDIISKLSQMENILKKYI